MKNITRLALALAVAAIASLAPMAHADEEALIAPGGGGIPKERYYYYYDKDGEGELYIKDGEKYNGYRKIYVELYQNGYTFYGEGKRSLTSEEDYWQAYCEFWLSGHEIKAKFKGYIPVKYVPDYEKGGGEYYLYGSNHSYWWECYLYED
jgi:hypothetical protein